MPFTTRRLCAALAAAGMVAALGADPVFAQGATVGPAGGIPSTTAPSNSQGTPSGGTGNLSTTRVGPSTTATAATPAKPRPRRTVRRTKPVAPVSDSVSPGPVMPVR